jgi:ribonuclease III
MTKTDQTQLEHRLGYRFRDKELLRRALTPPSSGITPNNQRLEFLGDAILQLCVSKLIFDCQPLWDEGAMSKLRGMLVCTASLRSWAQELELTLEKGPRTPKALLANHPGKPLADAIEALLAALYLDSGSGDSNSLEAVMKLVRDHFEAIIREAFPGVWEVGDAKTTLQEKAAASGLPAPVYELMERTGPDHAPVFHVRVRVGDRESIAVAGTLKGAQAEAARQLLNHFR